MTYEAYTVDLAVDAGGWQEPDCSFSVASAHDMQRVVSSSSNGSAATSVSNYSVLTPLTPIDHGEMTMADYYGGSKSSYYSGTIEDIDTGYSFGGNVYSHTSSEYEDLGSGRFSSHERGSYNDALDDMAMTPVGNGNHVPRTHYTDSQLLYDASTSTSDGNGCHVCLVPGCDKTFKRKADLERHYEQKHTADHLKKSHYCDYSKCQRRNDPFHRLDHFRDHYREFHKEDLPRKRGESDKWYDSRSYRTKWWRCPKCLERRYVEEDGWECVPCRSHCEPARVMRREALMQHAYSG